MVGTEMQAPAPLGTTVVLSFANNGEDTKLDLKNSFWQQRIFDSDLGAQESTRTQESTSHPAPIEKPLKP